MSELAVEAPTERASPCRPNGQSDPFEGGSPLGVATEGRDPVHGRGSAPVATECNGETSTWWAPSDASTRLGRVMWVFERQTKIREELESSLLGVQVSTEPIEHPLVPDQTSGWSGVRAPSHERQGG
jgi:hypothetical protein